MARWTQIHRRAAEQHAGGTRETRVSGRIDLRGPGASSCLPLCECRGQVASGLRDGEGKFVGADGSVYNGGWKGGKRHGQGELTFADGGVFNGQWNGGFKCGECEAALMGH